MKETHRDLARTTLGVLLIGALLAASFWILRPFLPAIVWATMIVVFTWHFMLRIQHWLWNRRSLAVTVMTLALLVILILPFSLAATTIISNTETVAHWVECLAGDRGETAVRLAAQAIHGVAMGVLLTAVVQSAVAGIGLAVCGIPFPIILTAVIFILCVAQIGPGLVLIPTVAWMYWSGDTVWATVMLVWSLVVLTMDNVLRPVLIKRSANLPLLLIFIGVIGGLLAFGLIGIFVGPVVLAVGFTLLQAWVAEDDPGPA